MEYFFNTIKNTRVFVVLMALVILVNFFIQYGTINILDVKTNFIILFLTTYFLSIFCVFLSWFLFCLIQKNMQ
jgi:uncharacterized membrane protein YbhN (UPF0104 family)